MYLVNFAKEGRKLIDYKINGEISGMLMSGKLFSITRYVMSDDIDDIRDSRYHMRRRTFFQPVHNLLCTQVCMGLDDSTCSECLLEWASQLDPPEHVPRPGPKLAYGVRAGSLCATEPRARGKTRGRKRKNAEGRTKHIIYICLLYTSPSPRD